MVNTLPPPRVRPELILWAVLGVAIFAVFGSTLYADFVRWDDDINIYRNPRIQGLTAENLSWMFTDSEYVRRYMPLGWLGWAVTYEWQGLNPAAYHLGNLVFQYLNALLVFVVIRKLLTNAPGPSFAAAARRDLPTFLAAAAGALFWALHPLRVETVAWASGRIYQQATLFLLVALLCYFRYAETAGSRRWGWYTGAIVGYAASLLTYPIGLGLLPVLMLIDLYPLRRWAPGTNHLPLRTRLAQLCRDKVLFRLAVEKVPFVAVAAFMFGVTLWCRVNTNANWRPPVTLDQFGMFPRVMQGFYVWACYLWKTWLPFDLAPLYITLVNFNPHAPVFWASALGVTGVSVALIWRWRQWPGVLVLWLAYLIMLFPMLGFTESPHYPSDRYGYIASIAYVVALAALVRHGLSAPGGRRSTMVGAVVVLLAMGTVSFQQCKIWRNSDAMFLHIISTLEEHPARGDVYHRLGAYRMEAGNYPGASEALSQALAIKPTSAIIEADLGDALALQGKLTEAIARYEAVLNRFPERRNVRLNLAHALSDLGRRPEAQKHYEELLAAHPSDAQVRLAFAQFLAGGGRFDEAIAQYLEARRLDANLEQVYVHLARAFSKQGNIRAAIATFREALLRQPNSPGTLVELAWIYATSSDDARRDAAQAVALATRANELTGGAHPRVLDTLAAAYAEAHRYADAVRSAEAALRLADQSQQAAIRDRLRLYSARQPFRETVARP